VNLSKDPNDEFRGIQISSFKINDVLIRTTMTFSFADAMKFISLKDDGDFTNKEFRDTLIKKITKEIHNAINSRN
jgi:hypothetical protein